MTLLQRRILFTLFVLFFLTVAPILVLYTAGYSYSFKNGTIERTGVISVASVPRNATVYVNSKSTRRTTPYVIKRLVPGKYSIALDRTGFFPWEGDVVVRAGETTFLQDVLLFRSDEPQVFADELPDRIFVSPKGDNAVYMQAADQEMQLMHLDIKTGRTVEYDTFPPRSTPSFDIEWSADGSFFFVRTDALFVYRENGALIETSTLAASDDVLWHPEHGSLLYIHATDTLHEWHIETQTRGEIDIDSTLAFRLDASIIFLRDNGANMELRQLAGNQNRLIALLPRNNYTLEMRDGDYLLFADHARGRFVLVNLQDSNPILLEGAGRIFDWSISRQRLAYSDGYEMNIYDARKHTVDFLTRQGEEIQHIEWHPSNDAVALSTRNAIDVIETEKQADQRRRTRIVDSFDDIQTFWMTPDGRTLHLFARSLDGEGYTIFEKRLR